MQRSLRCFGKNSYGQLGWHDSGKGIGSGYTSPTAGSYPSKPLIGENMPITTTGIEVATMTSGSVGGNHACVLVGEGNVWCWGLNDGGSAGVGQTLQQLAIAPPTPVNLNGKLAKTINCYSFVCCIIFQNTYEVSCFGQGANGRLGVGFYNIGETVWRSCDARFLVLVLWGWEKK
jgi:alpha-tubulin suppressor-like RCC1 family protein